MAFCNGCGNELKPNDIYCTACGRPINQSQSPSFSKNSKGDKSQMLPTQPITQKTNSAVIIGLIVLAMTSGAAIYNFLDANLIGDKLAKTPAKTEAQVNSQDGKTKGEQPLPLSISKLDRKALAALDSFVQAKDRYDVQIRNLAVAVNNRIGSPRGRLIAPDLQRQAQECQESIKATRTSLASSEFSAQLSGYKASLLLIYDLELTRIDGIRRGLIAGAYGGDYNSYFKVGGDAFEQFEVQNKSFDDAYRKLRIDVGY